MINIFFILLFFAQNVFAQDFSKQILSSQWDSKNNILEILQWPFSHVNPPDDWLECDGKEIDGSKYPLLKAKMSNTPNYKNNFLKNNIYNWTPNGKTYFENPIEYDHIDVNTNPNANIKLVKRKFSYDFPETHNILYDKPVYLFNEYDNSATNIIIAQRSEKNSIENKWNESIPLSDCYYNGDVYYGTGVYKDNYKKIKDCKENLYCHYKKIYDFYDEQMLTGVGYDTFANRYEYSLSNTHYYKLIENYSEIKEKENIKNYYNMSYSIIMYEPNFATHYDAGSDYSHPKHVTIRYFIRAR